MWRENYIEARKKAQKMYRSQILKGQYPYLQALDDLISQSMIISEVDLGVVEIPLDAVVGTRNAGRNQSFSSNFMPLLEVQSEFATKWIYLYQAHIEEGIRDPIKVVEFMNRFYVIEGNKRVSVLKFVDAVKVTAHVTRLIPFKDDSVENRIYYEFINFYKVSSVNYLNFSQEGSYQKLLSLLGKDEHTIWTDNEKLDFHSAYIHFVDVYEEKGGNKLSLTSGDAFLTYLEIYGYADLAQKSYQELREEIPAIWKDFEIFPKKRQIELLTTPDPEKTDKKSLVSMLLPFSSADAPFKIAFIHDVFAKDSSWVYSHELGRHYLENIFGSQIITSAYENCNTNEKVIEAIAAAVDDKNSIIFTTSPKHLNASVIAALKYPNIQIFNCSFNSGMGHLRTYYGRMYEAKFLMGILAGILSKEEAIGYVADYPIYGSMANINAFALGVRMVNPEAKIYLEWASVKGNRIDEYFSARRISYVSGQDLIKPAKSSRNFGLYNIRKDPVVNVAMPVWDWGKFYEKIVRSILNKNFQKNATQDNEKAFNYFWGMSSGLIDVIYSSHLPVGTMQLLDVMKKQIFDGNFQPFSGEIRSQDGTIQNEENNIMTQQQIASIDWLLDNVHGTIPEFEELTEEAKRIVQFQGVAKYEQQKRNILL